MTPRLITAAERAARKGQNLAGVPMAKTVGWHIKRSDGKRCPTCKPIISPTRPVVDQTIK